MGAATDKCGATDQGAAIDTDAAIEMRGVTVFRWSAALGRRTYLLRDLGWRVQPGEHWALLGPNGAGKSTLMQIAAATAQPSEGSVAVLGEEFGRADLRRLRERIGLVDERLARRLRPRLSAVEAVMTGAHGAIAPRPRRSRVDERARVEQERADERTRAGELLELVGLAGVAEREFGHCSQGERQRLLVARALMAEPELLLLDEPGAGMDLPSREGLIAALVSLATERPSLPTVTVTHHLEEIPSSCTHALLLANGHAVAAGPVAEVLASAAVSACFGLPIEVTHRAGRWSATATTAT